MLLLRPAHGTAAPTGKSTKHELTPVRLQPRKGGDHPVHRLVPAHVPPPHLGLAHRALRSVPHRLAHTLPASRRAGGGVEGRASNFTAGCEWRAKRTGLRSRCSQDGRCKCAAGGARPALPATRPRPAHSQAEVVAAGQPGHGRLHHGEAARAKHHTCCGRIQAHWVCARGEASWQMQRRRAHQMEHVSSLASPSRCSMLARTSVCL